MSGAKTGLVGFAVAAGLAIQLSAPAFAESWARDMFYQQLPDGAATAHVPPAHTPAASRPRPPHVGGVSHNSGSSGNVGMSYYIDLKRDLKSSKVDSRTHFRSGDSVQFHICPTVNCYCYVVMIGGTTGAQDVLFPVPGKDPSNQLMAGRDYAIPSVTRLGFDNHPGREHLRIALTRKPIEASKFLSPQASGQLAMATISPNPAIDPTSGKSQIGVSFSDDIPKAPPVVINHPAVPASAPTNDAAIENAIPDESPRELNSPKDMYREDASGAPAASHASRPRPRPHVAHRRPAGHPYRPAYTTTVAAPTPPPTTVVINKNANEDLYADISLEHD